MLNVLSKSLNGNMYLDFAELLHGSTPHTYCGCMLMEFFYCIIIHNCTDTLGVFTFIFFHIIVSYTVIWLMDKS